MDNNFTSPNSVLYQLNGLNVPNPKENSNTDSIDGHIKKQNIEFDKKSKNDLNNIHNLPDIPSGSSIGDIIKNELNQKTDNFIDNKLQDGTNKGINTDLQIENQKIRKSETNLKDKGPFWKSDEFREASKDGIKKITNKTIDLFTPDSFNNPALPETETKIKGNSKIANVSTIENIKKIDKSPEISGPSINTPNLNFKTFKIPNFKIPKF